jgi:glyoxylase-like metal-dependent hydrolase (beta-lactamase superfamily II)
MMPWNRVASPDVDPNPTESRLQRASEHVWWFTPDERTERPALGAVAGTSSTALLEVGASVAHTASFLQALEPLGLPPLRAAVLTHWHWDHSFGGAALDVPIIAHRDTAAELARQAALDWSDAALDARVEAGEEIAFCRDMIRIEIPDRSDLEIVLPQIVFDDHLELDLGGVRVAIDHVGGDHAADSCVFHVVEDDLIVLGDCLYQRLYAPEPFLTVASVQALTARIGAYGARLAIEGHGDTLLDGEALARRLSGLAAAADRVERLGDDALATARDEDDRETLEFLLTGRA